MCSFTWESLTYIKKPLHNKEHPLCTLWSLCRVFETYPLRNCCAFTFRILFSQMHKRFEDFCLKQGHSCHYIDLTCNFAISGWDFCLWLRIWWFNLYYMHHWSTSITVTCLLYKWARGGSKSSKTDCIIMILSCPIFVRFCSCCFVILVVLIMMIYCLVLNYLCFLF